MWSREMNSGTGSGYSTTVTVGVNLYNKWEHTVAAGGGDEGGIRPGRHFSGGGSLYQGR